MRTSYKTLTNDEFNVLNRIATETKCDCWFSLRQNVCGTDYVYDLEENKQICLRTGVKLLMEAIDLPELFQNCHLSLHEKLVLDTLLIKLDLNTKQ